MMRQDGKLGFLTPTGKVELWSTILEKHGFDPLPVYKPPPRTTADYPLFLMTGPRVPYYTHSKWRNTWWTRKMMPEPVIDINPDDAATRGISDGDSVIVKTPRGGLKVKANLTLEVPRGGSEHNTRVG